MTLEGWNYRKSHTITHPTGGLTNYQTKIRVYRTTGTDSGDTVYVGDKCLADFGDIRFTNSTGTELDYWMETNAGSYADFWVKLDSITTSATFYIYYGNSEVTTTSNGDTTFVFFDDFTLGTLNTTTKWSVVSGQSYSIADGVLTVSGANDTADYIISQSAYPTNTILHLRSKWSNTSGSSLFGFCQTLLTNQAVSYNTAGYRYTTYVSGYNVDGATVDANWHNIDIIRNGTTSVIFKQDASTVHTATTQVPTGNLSILLRQYVSGSNQQHDLIFIKAYTATEPTHSTWGTEESLGSPLANWTYRQSHIINGNVTDYQVKLTLQYGTGESSSDTVYLNTHARSDFGDVRFTDSAGNLLSYWIESQTNGSTAIVWVKGTFLGDTTIYVYYGNAAAGTTSNGDTTFVFFDDFLGTSLNTSKWNPILIAYNSGKGTISVNNALTLTQTNGADKGVSLRSVNALSSNTLTLRVKVNARSAGTSGTQIRFVLNNSSNTNAGVFGLYTQNNGTSYLHNDFGVGNPSFADTFTVSSPTIYEWEGRVANPRAYKDGVLKCTGSGTPTAPAGNYIRIWTYSTSASVTLDWIAARSYAATEPTHSTWGAEQDIGATSFTIRITPTSGTDPLSVTYNCIIPEGTLDNFTLSYGDGNEYTTASQSTFATTHTYDTPGTYTVWGEGYTEFATHVYYEIPYGVNVSAPSVVASFTTSQSYNTVTFTNTSTGNINECYWDFGDGLHSYETNPIHTYYSPATYNVTLYTSNQYQYSSTTGNVTITQILTPPSAYFTPARLDVINPTLPYNVTFTNLSTPTFGCTYNWTVDGGSVSTDENPTISFSDYGLYDVGLTVTNALGSSSRVYNDAIRLTRKSRTMNEVVGGSDTFATFGVQVFNEYATGSDLPIVYATILPEGVYFVQREIPDVPGIDEWGVRHLYSTINEWGVKIFNTINSWGHKILHNSSSVDRTPLRCIDVEIFEETVIVSDDHQFDEDPS